MRIHFTFRNLDSSDGIKTHASDKLTRMQKYVRSPIEATVTVWTEALLHCVDMSLIVDGHRYAARESCEDMYASIDLAVDKIDRQIRDAKASTRTKKRHSGEQLAVGKNT